MTLDERLEQTDFRPAGFDYMRLVLAVMVIASHTVIVCYGGAANGQFYSYPTRVPFAMVLPMFFALSGFLVAGSLERSGTIVAFLGLRLFRLVPALAVETMLSALVLGPLFTTLVLAKYYTDQEFATYFLNIVGEIHMSLPGVFNDLPFPGIVNLQLWTLPWELKCYVAISVLALVGIVRRPRLFATMMLGLQVLEILRKIFISPPPATAITVGGPALVLSFLFGVMFYLNKGRVPWSRTVFWIALLICIALGLRSGTAWAMPLPAAYVTVYLGLTAPPRINLLLSGDYSYGLFLYGFPIQQAVAALTPRIWWVNLIISLAVAGTFAVLSWRFVERPLHERRRIVFKLERALLDWLRARSWASRQRRPRTSLSDPAE